MGRGTFERGDICRPIVTYLRMMNVPECIRRREGWQDGDAACCQITLDSFYLSRTTEEAARCEKCRFWADVLSRWVKKPRCVAINSETLDTFKCVEIDWDEDDVFIVVNGTVVQQHGRGENRRLAERDRGAADVFRWPSNKIWQCHYWGSLAVFCVWLRRQWSCDVIDNIYLPSSLLYVHSTPTSQSCFL